MSVFKKPQRIDMPISNERLKDRIEFLKAFLELKSAFEVIAVKSKLQKDADVEGAIHNLTSLFDSMLDKLEKEQQT